MSNSADFWFYAVQGSIIEFFRTYEEAEVFGNKLEREEQEEAGEDFDYFDSLQEYGYAKSGSFSSIRTYAAGEGGHTKAYSQIGGMWWHSQGDTYWGTLPDWIASQVPQKEQ